MSVLVDVLEGRSVSRRPVWIMRQAGRYLPEYRKLRKRHDFLTLCRTPELAGEVTLQPLRRFPLDAAIVFADLMSPIAALGVGIRFEPGPVVSKPIRTLEQVRQLPDPEEGEIAPEVAETLALVRRELPEDQALLGFAGAPWTLAAYLIEGRGAKGFPRARALAAAEPALLEELLKRLSRLVLRYCRSQVSAGADAVQIFDSWAGLLSLDSWQQLVAPHLEWLLEELERAGIRRILFLQDAPHLVPAFSRLPVDALSVDWREDLATIRRRLGSTPALQGNLDPAVLLAGPEPTQRAARALLQRTPSEGHIVNLGHGILPETPLASVDALLEAVHDEEVLPHERRPTESD